MPAPLQPCNVVERAACTHMPYRRCNIARPVVVSADLLPGDDVVYMYMYNYDTFIVVI